MGRANNLTPSELLEYSREHVFYELQMLFGASFILTTGAQVILDWSIRMALIEACVVHLRNLIVFLYPGRIQAGDVLAEDFLDKPDDWEKVRPAITDALTRAKQRADKEIAHLTTDRIPGAPPEKAWDFAALLADLRPALHEFARRASPSRLDPGLVAQILKL